MDDELTTKYGYDARRRRDRMAFLDVSNEDIREVGQLLPVFREIAGDFAEVFYAHLLNHEETGRFLRDADRLERLKGEQSRYFEELFSGVYDRDYFEGRLRVGQRHQTLGLEPHWYLGAYSLFVQTVLPRLAEGMGAQIPAGILAVLKLVFLDIQLAINAYVGESTAELRNRNRDVERLLDMYFHTEVRAQQYARLAGHELRGSLNGIANACDEVVEDFSDEIPTEALETLRKARERCWSLADVVERILAQPEKAGQPDWVEVGPLFEEISNRVPLYAGNKQIRFVCEPVSARVWADPVGLREVVANLVSNAVRHMDGPRGTVEVTYQATGRHHVFGVRDDGPGISRDDQTRVFEPFCQLPGREHREGHGLGLYFVRNIVRQHGGEVWVESVPGSGSRFTFTIPRSDGSVTRPK